MKTKRVILIGVFVLLALLLGFGIWEWFFCRFYVPASHMAIITAKSGRTPAPGSILVERGEKGIWREVLGEGRHFLNPILYDVKIAPAVTIPLGKIGIVSSKIGKPLPPGEIMAQDQQSQGVWKDVLGPGTHRLNPQGYDIELVDAIHIPVGYIGIVTSQTGKSADRGKFASEGEKGVLKDILQPGLYYVNTRAYQVNVIEIGMNQVSMLGGNGVVLERKSQISATNKKLEELSQNILTEQAVERSEYFSSQSSNSFSDGANKVAAPANKPMMLKSKAPPVRATKKTHPNAAVYSDKVDIAVENGKAYPAGQSPEPNSGYSISGTVEFPSEDGFVIQLEMTVEFELMPEKISLVYLLYGDLPQVVQKIILPQALSISRLMGSNYKAQDFIMGDGREKFQENLRSELVRAMLEKSIIIHNAIIRNVVIPANILRPIQEAAIAVEQNLTNASLQETAKIEADLNSQSAMITQRQREVQKETERMVAEIAANQKQTVRMIQANTQLEVAKINLQTAAIRAKTEQLRGETEVKAKFLVENENARGTALKSNVLAVPGLLAQLDLIENLSPTLTVNLLFAGEGTLWTDLKNAGIALPSAAIQSAKPLQHSNAK